MQVITLKNLFSIHFFSYGEKQIAILKVHLAPLSLV